MAGDIYVQGDQTLKSEPTEILSDPFRGMSFRKREFAPLNRPAILNRLNQVIAAGGSARVIYAQDDPVIESEYAGIPADLAGVIAEKFFDRWDLIVNELSESIFVNPRMVDANVYPSTALNYNNTVVLSRLSRMGAGATIEDAVDACNADRAAGTLPAPATAGPYGGGTAGGLFRAPPSGSIGSQVYLEVLKDQVTYEEPSYVLSHTTVCYPTSTYNVARANQMKIYTPAQLLTEISSGWSYNCPSRYISEIAAVPVKTAAPAEAGFYTWGWLKKITRSSFQTNFTIEVSTEYVLRLWSNLRYEPAS